MHEISVKAASQIYKHNTTVSHTTKNGKPTTRDIRHIIQENVNAALREVSIRLGQYANTFPSPLIIFFSLSFFLTVHVSFPKSVLSFLEPSHHRFVIQVTSHHHGKQTNIVNNY